ncbi:Histidine biosynthesis bifunctional protein hisB, partial [Basidiobolus ranarum]
MSVYLLDYGAGNVRSLLNAVNKLGYEILIVKEPADILKADKIIFPGVGAFGSAMDALVAKGYVEPIKQYIASGKPFMGICVGMQTMFEGCEESPGVKGLGIVPGIVKKFNSTNKAVPHMGWNEAELLKIQQTGQQKSFGINSGTVYYFVHSYAVPYSEALKDWAFTTTQYGDEVFVSSIQRENVFCTQFHPEKSGFAGLRILREFLSGNTDINESDIIYKTPTPKHDCFTKRIIACLDVRANDTGDLVVTKGDQYDVREKPDGDSKGDVRNLGKPVELAKRYFEEGADEITFLNITSFRNCPLGDLPMLEVLRRPADTVFVPLTIVCGIRYFVADGRS